MTEVSARAKDSVSSEANKSDTGHDNARANFLPLLSKLLSCDFCNKLDKTKLSCSSGVTGLKVTKRFCRYNFKFKNN